MTIINIVTDQVEIRTQGHTQVKVEQPQVVTDTNVRPWPLVSYSPEKSPIYKGFPRKPMIDCSATTLVSSQGLHFDGDRPDPFSVDLGADVRFIAHEDFWDNVGFIWSPYVSNLINYTWTGAALTSPILNDYQYRVGKEVFNQKVLSFDGSTLNSAFNDDFDDAVAFTVAVVIAPRSTNDTILTMPTENIQLDVEPLATRATYISKSQKIQTPYRLPIGNFVYLIASIQPPIGTFYLAYSQTRLFVESIFNTNTAAFDMIFTLGGTTSAFDLAEFALWNGAMDRSSIVQLVGQLTSIYGE